MDAEERKEHERRLKHLRIRAAKQGVNTPPEVLTEIEDIQRLLDDTAESAATTAREEPPVPFAAVAGGSRPILEAYKREVAPYTGLPRRKSNRW